jgi:hypothetical protein
MELNMRIGFSILTITVAILLTGCSTSMEVTKPYSAQEGALLEYEVIDNAKITEQGMAIFQSRIEQELRARGRLANNDLESQQKVEINITKYRMRHGATRALVGIFAGTDSMKSTVIIKDKKTGNIISEFKVETANATAYYTSRAMISDHADEIVNYISPPLKTTP